VSRLNVYGFLGVGIGLLIGMIGHELAHAWTAVKLGDQTPRMMGRLTLNPKAHADPVGTLILPGIFLVSVLFKSSLGFLFGYAKPVTIHPGRLRNPKRDAITVALAGPFFNLIVAVATGIGFRALAASPVERLEVAASFVFQTGDEWRVVLIWITVVNTFLFIINILPIPPLDGSKILTRFLSPSAAMRMEEWSQYLLLFLIALFLIFRGVLGNIAEAIYDPILGF
jgi:Zn-dependent protease